MSSNVKAVIKTKEERRNIKITSNIIILNKQNNRKIMAIYYFYSNLTPRG